MGRRGRGHSNCRPDWEREEPLNVSHGSLVRTTVPQVGGACMPRIPGAFRLGSRLQIAQCLPPRSEYLSFSPCRGKRRGDRGKSIKNPPQVRPYLSSSGGSSPCPHINSSSALAQMGQQCLSHEPQGLGPLEMKVCIS